MSVYDDAGLVLQSAEHYSPEEVFRYRILRLRQARSGILIVGVFFLLAAVGASAGAVAGVSDGVQMSEHGTGKPFSWWLMLWGMYILLIPVAVASWIPGLTAVQTLTRTPRSGGMTEEQVELAESAAVQLWRRTCFVLFGILIGFGGGMGVVVLVFRALE